MRGKWKNIIEHKRVLSSAYRQNVWYFQHGKKAGKFKIPFYYTFYRVRNSYALIYERGKILQHFTVVRAFFPPPNDGWMEKVKDNSSFIFPDRGKQFAKKLNLND